MYNIYRCTISFAFFFFFILLYSMCSLFINLLFYDNYYLIVVCVWASYAFQYIYIRANLIYKKYIHFFFLIYIHICTVCSSHYIYIYIHMYNKNRVRWRRVFYSHKLCVFSEQVLRPSTNCWTCMRFRIRRSVRTVAVIIIKGSIVKNCCAGTWSTNVAHRPNSNVQFARNVSRENPTWKLTWPWCTTCAFIMTVV